MITYVSRFIPKLASITANLRQLIKKNVQWCWTKTHQQNFDHLKNLLSSSPLLHFYDKHKPITLSVDNSKHRIGAVILQDKAPIAYAQIEKEYLAIIFGCHHCIFMVKR